MNIQDGNHTPVLSENTTL